MARIFTVDSKGGKGYGKYQMSFYWLIYLLPFLYLLGFCLLANFNHVTHVTSYVLLHVWPIFPSSFINNDFNWLWFDCVIWIVSEEVKRYVCDMNYYIFENAIFLYFVGKGYWLFLLQLYHRTPRDFWWPFNSSVHGC